MDIAFQIVNSISGKSLQRRLFNLEEGTPDIILHTDERWLNRNKFLQRFRSLLSKNKNFFEEERR
jgi:hypothetical protein